MKLFNVVKQTDTSPAVSNVAYWQWGHVTWDTFFLPPRYLQLTRAPRVHSSVPPLLANQQCRLPRRSGISWQKHQQALTSQVKKHNDCRFIQPEAVTWTWRLCGLPRPKILCAFDLDPFGYGRKCKEDRSACLWTCLSDCNPPKQCEESKKKNK